MWRNILRNTLFGIILLSITSIGVKKFNPSEAIPETNVRNNVEVNQNVVSSRMTYGRFLEYLEMGWVKQVDLYDNSRNAIVVAVSPESDDRSQTIRVEIPVGASQLIQKLKEYDVDFDAHPAENKNLWVTVASNVLLPILFVGGLFYFFQNSENFPGGGGQSQMNIGKSTARFEKRPDTGVVFKDIAGIDEAKAEFEEIVSFLREPERYTLVGAKIPKGVLLVGPPGTGKTLLAKAIASEANVPFYNVAGSEFVEMFIGIGAARIRDLFKKASENTPCIVFIDEIDAVGSKRYDSTSGGTREIQRTMLELLNQLDGFDERGDVKDIMATNKIESLDPALIRPGRIDRKIEFPLPDTKTKRHIFNIHTMKMTLADDVDLEIIVMAKNEFSGADIKAVCAEAGMLTLRERRMTVCQEDFVKAKEKALYRKKGNIPEGLYL